MRRRRAAAVAALGVLLAGCGLPAHDVHHLSRESVPFDLLSSTRPSPSSRAVGPSAVVYFVTDERLRATSRRLVGDNLPAEAVRALLIGPTATEAASGYATDVPTQTRLVSLDLSGSTATVDLSSEFGTVGGSDQVLAVAQIVFTLTESSYIKRVRFAINGKPAEVPDASGSLSAVPRSRADYAEVAPHR